MALPMLQSAFMMKALPITTLNPTPSSRTPSSEYVATRLHSIANFKLRLESSQNEPRLRHLLGHIFVYDAIREHQQSQPVHTSPTASRRREQQLRRRQQSEMARQPSWTPITESVDSNSTSNADDIAAYLDTLPSKDIPPSSVQGFLTFQQAIESQLATLTQLRLENASRQLYNMTRDADDQDDLAVEEYQSDGTEDSDYDSYDGDDGDWRFEDEDGQTDDGPGDSDTDPESMPSEPASPTTEEPLGCEQSSKCLSASGNYFPPLAPVVPTGGD